MNELPEELPALPAEHVYLGKGGEFKIPDRDGSKYLGQGGMVPKDENWWHFGLLAFESSDVHYCAHRDSEIAKLNATKRYTLAIEHDDFLENPRSWDNLGTIAYRSDRYNLGDWELGGSEENLLIEIAFHEGTHDDIFVAVKDFADAKYSYMTDVLGYSHEQASNEADAWLQEESCRVFDKLYISLPVYAYIHGGITISTGGFSCPWDSGQVGIIYVDRNVLQHFEDEEQVIKALKAEIEIFDSYLQGFCYAFSITDQFDELHESYSGYIGEDFEHNGLYDEIKSLADDYPFDRIKIVYADRSSRYLDEEDKERFLSTGMLSF